MAVGILRELDDGDTADTLHREIILLTIMAYVVGSLLAVAALKGEVNWRAQRPTISFEYPVRTVWFWFGVSILISIAYYVSVGYVAFFESLRIILSGEEADLAGLRLNSYSGPRYLFPGYVNQFKNALLPALFIVILTSSSRSLTVSRKLVYVGIGLIVVLLLIGTGQRHPLVRALALALIFAYYLVRKIPIKQLVVLGIAGGAVFFLTTFASGRAADQLSSATSTSERLGILFDQMIYRFFAGDQGSATVAFRYLYYAPDVPRLSEWSQALMGLLPGHPGSDLAGQVFRVLYGSTRGTTPPSLWGSSFHNLGLIPTVMFAGTLGIAFTYISWRFMRRNSLNLLQAVGIAGITVTLGLWTTDGPTTPINSGVVVFIVLLCWGDWAEKNVRHATEPSLALEKPPQPIDSRVRT